MVTLSKANHDHVELTKLDEAKTLVLTAATAVSGVYGAKYEAPVDSEKITVIIAGNSSANNTVTIKEGDTQFGVERTVVAPKDGMVALNIDNGAHKNILGADKGYVILTASAAFSVAVIEAAF